MEAILDRLHMLEVLADEGDKIVVVQVPGGADDEIAGAEPLRIKAEHGIALEALYRVFGAKDRTSERVVLPKILGKNLMDEVVGTVFVHFDFFQDDAALTGDVLGMEDGVEDQITQHVHRDREVLIQHLDVEADAFLGGEGVHIYAD